MSSSEFKDYYTTLGVEKTATAEEIKKKFRKLALKYHPDRNQGDKTAEAKFKECSEAYDVLSDREKRAEYDRFGQYWQQTQTSARYSATNTSTKTSTSSSNPKPDFNSADFSQYGNFEEFINELLGKFSSTGDGSTAKTYSTQTTQTTAQNIDGFSQQSNDSSKAKINLTYAEAYKGTVKLLTIGTKTFEVRIPAGAKPNSRIRVPGKGQIYPDTQIKGDLYLEVQLDSHPFFRFEGEDLACEVPIAPDEAVLGVSLSIPTPDGRVSMRVPAGVSSGQVLRLRGKGWSYPNGERSDQLVKVIISIPQKISSEEKQCYEKIRDLRREDPRQSLQGIQL